MVRKTGRPSQANLEAAAAGYLQSLTHQVQVMDPETGTAQMGSKLQHDEAVDMLKHLADALDLPWGVLTEQLQLAYKEKSADSLR